MNTSTVNISFRTDLLKEIDKIASDESRTRSALIREAARMYIERRQRWTEIFSFGKKQVRKLKLTENDVGKEVRRYRRGKR